MSHAASYKESIQALAAKLKPLGQAIPGTVKGFQALQQAATAPGALDAKTKELIALALGVAARCEGCVAFHAQTLAKVGATREEVAETLGVAVLMGGGPSMMWAAEALSAFDEFKSA
ncbi:MAG: carboxymuconolactone decarboxylase family protein [Candidatus Accumulibacter sp.]|jgi:AhpD family alkylhydroperoxidase|nr:carboxymuconolactone decarboxylase family protein [Accumulibacter sp.]